MEGKNGKVCTKCNQLQPVTNFYSFFNPKLNKMALKSRCKLCQAEIQRDYYHKNLEKERERNRTGASQDVVNLTDRYIKSRLYSDFGLDYNTINNNPELVEIKRTQLLLNRKIKENEEQIKRPDEPSF